MPEEALVKLAPEVMTHARPTPEVLLAARILVQKTAEIRDVFARSKEEHWPADRLALEIEEPLQSRLATGDPQEVVQVARYLADEYQQMGDTMLLISRETGMAIGRVTDDDIWQPDPVPREGGGMARPLPKLRPDLEAFIIHWQFERGQERRQLAEIGPNLHPTELLRQEGDPRLAPLTRAGRARLVEQLRGELPRLLSRASGSVGTFLGHFEVRESDPPTEPPYKALLRCTAVARAVTGIQDAKAMNLKFNRLGGLCGRIGNDWGREIARTLAVAARQHFDPATKPYRNLSEEDQRGVTLWVGDPDTLDVLVREVLLLFARHGSLAVEHAPITSLLGKVGVLVVNPESFDCQGREIFGRWEVAAKFEYTLWVDWSKVRSFDLSEVPHFATALVASR